ncbi:MAG: histidine phosphatase family protein [Bdellovibrionota bacterium]
METSFADQCALFAPQFFYLRHGETDFHGAKRICGGASDPVLNAVGLKQAEATALAIKKAKCGIKTICSSDLLRNIQTTDFVHDRIPAKVRVFEALRERHLGSWEGAEMATLADRWSGGLGVDAPPGGGESLEAFSKRIQAAVLHCLQLPAPVLFVGHGIFGLHLQKLLGIDPPTKVGRGEWFEFVHDGPRWRMVMR